MKKVLLLAERLWTKNIFSNIMVMILAFITFYLFSMLYNKYQSFYGTSNYYSSTPLNSSLLFMGQEPATLPDTIGSVIDPQYINEFVKEAEESGIVSSLSAMYNSSVTLNGDVNTILRVYDETTASFIKNSLTIEGEWLFEEEISGYYPVVVRNGTDPESSNFKIGDTFSLELDLRPENSLIDDSCEEKICTVQCVVVGISSDKTQTAFFLPIYKSSFADSVENTFLSSPVDPVRTLLYFPYDEKLFGDYVYTSDSVIAYFDENATDEQIAEFYDRSCELGYSLLCSDIINASKEEGDYQFQNNFFVFYSLIILTIVSIFCISFLNVKKICKNFAVYYINGCTRIRSALIYFLYFILLYTLPLILYLIITQIQNLVLTNSNFSGIDFIKSDLYKVNIAVPIVAWIIGIIVSALASIAPFAVMKGKTIIENLRED